MYYIIYVDRGTVVRKVTLRELQRSKLGFGKDAYTYKEEIPCEYHLNYLSQCQDCRSVIISHSKEDNLNYALEAARLNCDSKRDTWLVDGDSRQVVAAFRATIERIV